MFNGSRAADAPNDISNGKDWFFIPQPQPAAALRLFCFPFAGGGSVIYYNWPEFFNPKIEIVALRLPGRETRFTEKPFVRMSQLISSLLPALHPLLNKPFAIFGHSMGARIGFDLIRALR
ncbi:MAG: putative thioesterase, partial [Desulfobacteraceae bacterium]